MSESADAPCILTINGGSSSLKFAVFTLSQPLVRVAAGRIERIGLPDAVMTVTDVKTGHQERRAVSTADHRACLALLLDELERKGNFARLRGVGHRVVHGGNRYSRPQQITPEVLAELRRLGPYDPEHLPAEIGFIEAFIERSPHLMQVACFDTAFHRDLPAVARLLPIPRRLAASGIHRYGFHGLSCAYLMKELARIGRPDEANGRVILAHLGNGASLTAVRRGRSLDTTMGFTPTGGLPMSTRSGDLDPGLVAYLARTEGMTFEQFHAMVNTRSGLLGVSELSPDVRDLLAKEQTDSRAAEAVNLFCYHAKKGIGAMTAALGGLDTLVFSGGIGENAPAIRARICEGLDCLGIALEDSRNETAASVISKEGSRVTVRVIRTDEESEIAQSVYELLVATKVTVRTL
jgi:acetate kinase